MRERIQAIVEECFSDQINEPCAYCTATDRLLALFATETQAMREALLNEVADNDELLEVGRKAIEDELIEW